MPQQETSRHGFQPSRRRFNQGLVATAAFAAVPVPALVFEGAAATFAIQAAPGISVSIGNGPSFDVITRARNGSELERFQNVTSASIHSLKSANFKVARVQAPVAHI